MNMKRSGLLIGWVSRFGSSEEKRSYMYQKGKEQWTTPGRTLKGWKLEGHKTQNENAKKKRRKAHPNKYKNKSFSFIKSLIYPPCF
jgi:hypothetical protein